MTNPKMKPCPRCGTAEHLSVYGYGYSSVSHRHVECDRCFYIGPGEGSIRAAIKAHNARIELRPNLTQQCASENES